MQTKETDLAWKSLKFTIGTIWHNRDKRQTQDSCKTDSTFSKDFLVSSGLKMSFRSRPANGWVHWWVMTWVSWASDFSRLWFVKVYSTLKAYTLWVQHTLKPETSNLQSLSSGAMIDWRLVSCSTVSYLRRTVGLAWDIDGYDWLWWLLVCWWLITACGDDHLIWCLNHCIYILISFMNGKAFFGEFCRSPYSSSAWVQARGGAYVQWWRQLWIVCIYIYMYLCMYIYISSIYIYNYIDYSIYKYL